MYIIRIKIAVVHAFEWSANLPVVYWSVLSYC